MMLLAKKPTTSVNPLRSDPSRTGPIRRAFCRVLLKKMAELKTKVYNLIVTQNILGLTSNTAWKFNTNDEQLNMFKNWLANQMKDMFFEKEADSWWAEYIRQGWQLGAARAYNQWQNKSEFLRSAFNQPVSIEKVKLLAGRVFTELEGVTQDMATKMSRNLVDGLIQGKSPRAIASDMAKTIDGITKQRALVIARTEIVRANAEGQLDQLEALGMDEVGVAVEWTVSGLGKTGKNRKGKKSTKKGNPSPCPLCKPMAGVVFKIEEARGMIPRHPNCLCSFVPANVGEDKKGQKTSYRRINESLKQSIKAGAPKRFKDNTKAAMKATDWAGAKVEIDRDRPESILNMTWDEKLNLLK